MVALGSKPFGTNVLSGTNPLPYVALERTIKTGLLKLVSKCLPLELGHYCYMLSISDRRRLQPYSGPLLC